MTDDVVAAVAIVPSALKEPDPRRVKEEAKHVEAPFGEVQD
jgi:hypothetical protein